MKFDLFYDTALQHVIAVADAAFSKVSLADKLRNGDYLEYLAATGLAAYSKASGRRNLLTGYISKLQKLGVIDDKRETVDEDALFAMADSVIKAVGQFNIFGIVFNNDDLTSLKTVIKEAVRVHEC
jgi:hypothetical protein